MRVLGDGALGKNNFPEAPGHEGKMLFVVRFVTGGLIIATLPVVANRFGAKVAGILVTMPVLTTCGFLALGTSVNRAAIQTAAKGSLLAIPSSIAYLLVLRLVIGHGLPLVPSLAVAVGAWAAFAILAGALL